MHGVCFELWGFPVNIALKLTCMTLISQKGVHVGAGSHRLQVSFGPGLLSPDAKLCLPCS